MIRIRIRPAAPSEAVLLASRDDRAEALRSLDVSNSGGTPYLGLVTGDAASAYFACISRMAGRQTAHVPRQQPGPAGWSYLKRCKDALVQAHTSMVFGQTIDLPATARAYLGLHMVRYYFGQTFFPEETEITEALLAHDPKIFRRIHPPAANASVALALYACLSGHKLIIFGESLPTQKMFSDWAAKYRKVSPHGTFEPPLYVR